MNRRRSLYIFLSILGLFLLGTAVVLSSVTYYLAIDSNAYLTELDVPFSDNTTRWHAGEHGQVEVIPRIIHQTWKTEELPTRWQPISQACRSMMPDYEYMLWTDKSSRELIAEHYPWFLDTYDGYKYPIQRADVIRYFVLHRFGGVYMDLDIGCLRPMDPLLVYPVILPKTIPVGISNDLIFGAKGHPFFQQTIHNLVTFDHSWILNYPTVMFSTGPMFLSAQYSIYTSSHPKTALSDVRILPKSLYGKNAKPEEVPHSFFSHFYGSSWHADDAAFIGFLASWGKVLMWVGLVILVIGLVRLPKGKRRNFRRIRGYDVLLPRPGRSGRWYLPLLSSSSAPSTQVSSPVSSGLSSPTDTDDVPFLRLPLNVTPPSPTSEFDGHEPFAGRVQSPLVDAFRRVRNRVSAMTNTREEEEVPMTPLRPRTNRYGRGVLFFLPAIFTTTHSQDVELDVSNSSSAPPPYTPPNRRASLYPTEEEIDEKRQLMLHDLESGSDLRALGSHSQGLASLSTASSSSNLGA